MSTGKYILSGKGEPQLINDLDQRASGWSKQIDGFREIVLRRVLMESVRSRPCSSGSITVWRGSSDPGKET